MNTNINTLTGLTLAAAQERLDKELPAEAYTPVPGGANLTDIDPGYMRQTLNSVFGLCGWGWGYEYDAHNLETRTEVRTRKSGEQEVVVAALKGLRFWYKLQIEGETIICRVDASGGSENSNVAYAMKGAITNAIGNAASNIGFQEAVYLGHRSHVTVRKPSTGKPAESKAPASPAPKAVQPPAAEKPSGGNGNGHKPEAKAAAAAPTAPVEPPPADPGDCGNFVVPIGAANKGKRLSDVAVKDIVWYAGKMQANTDAASQLKVAAAAYLKAHPEITPVAA